MRDIPVESLRNVAIISHGGAGKTSLLEAILFDTGATDRLGNVAEGTSILDSDPDEIKRKITISSALAFCRWKAYKINFVDTPGYVNFIAETQGCTRIVDSAVLLIGAVSGVKVQTQKVWKFADDNHLSRIVFVNEMDHERANFLSAVEELKKSFAVSPVLLQLPLFQEGQFRGVVDLLGRGCLVFSADGGGKMTEEAIPAERQEEVEEYRKQLVEVVAESDDSLLEKYLESGDLDEETLRSGLRRGTLEGKLVPVVCGSATRNMGIQPLLDGIVNLLPSPKDRPLPQGVNSRGESVERAPDFSAPFSALVFKTIADPYAGKLSLFRVYSGELSSDSTCYNKTRETKERIGQIFILQGKNQKPVDSAGAGDFAAVAKLKETTTGDTLCDEKAALKYAPITFPEPVISFAIAPKTKGDEEKLSNALGRLMEEDPTLRTKRDPQTKELILSGMGQVHIEVILERLKRKFGVEVEMRTPKVPYKETIRGRAKAQGRYKKQTGGRGQYGDTWIEIEPMPRGGGFEFVDKIVGGVIPRQYIPAVEKGIAESKEQGVLAGYPVVDFRVTLYDGSFHEVDSSEMAFKIAGSLGFKKAVTEANPVLLEPVMNLEVIVPDDCMGDIIGDLNARRGRVLGVIPQGNQYQSIKAQAPMSEVLQYASGLRSMTGGRGDFTMEFSHYEEVPGHLTEKIIAESKREAGKE